MYSVFRVFLRLPNLRVVEISVALNMSVEMYRAALAAPPLSDTGLAFPNVKTLILCIHGMGFGYVRHFHGQPLL